MAKNKDNNKIQKLFKKLSKRTTINVKENK